MARARKRPTVAIWSSQGALRVPRKRIDELIAYVASAQRGRIAEVDVAVVSADEMAALNRRFLGRRGPTDVLSFDMSDSAAAPLSVQIIVCADVAVAAAAARGSGPQQELLLYVVHGLLHVMGYDHRDARGAARMHAREEELLAGFRDRSRRRA